MDLGNFFNQCTNGPHNDNCNKPPNNCNNKGIDIMTLIIIFILFSCFNKGGKNCNPNCADPHVGRRRRGRREEFIVFDDPSYGGTGGLGGILPLLLLFLLFQGQNAANNTNTNTILNVDQLSDEDEERTRNANFIRQ